MKYIPSAMKFVNQGRSSLLMINMKFEIADLDPKLKTWIGQIWSQNYNVPDYYGIWH